MKERIETKKIGRNSLKHVQNDDYKLIINMKLTWTIVIKFFSKVP